MTDHFRPDEFPAEDRATTYDDADVAAELWGRFQDHLETAVASMDGSVPIDLTAVTGEPWMIRVQAGWEGIDGPGTFAYHVRLGSRDAEGPGPWSHTPYATCFGFDATRVAGAVSTLGLDHHPMGATDPSMVASGPVGALEVADTVVELLREAFRVPGPAWVVVSGDPEWEFPRLDPPQPAPAGADWWRANGFCERPWISPAGDRLVGWIDGVLVDVEHDRDCLPGLSVATVRARITDPSEEPSAAPGRRGPSFLDRLQSDASEVALDTVLARGHVAHTWAHRMVIAAVDEPGGTDTTGVRDAVRHTVDFVFSLRMVAPEAVRPSRSALRPPFG